MAFCYQVVHVIIKKYVKNMLLNSGIASTCKLICQRKTAWFCTRTFIIKDSKTARSSLTSLCSETCTVVTLDSIISLYHGLQSPEWPPEMLELSEPRLSQVHAPA